MPEWIISIMCVVAGFVVYFIIDEIVQHYRREHLIARYKAANEARNRIVTHPDGKRFQRNANDQWKPI